MREKENVPAGGGTPTGTGQEKRQGVAAIPYNYSTTGSLERQPLRVSDFLGRGPESALHMKELKQLLHEDSRTIRRMIEHERRNQIPIVSDNRRGYWLAETRAEIEAFCKSMRARAFEINRTAALVQLAELEAGADG